MATRDFQTSAAKAFREHYDKLVDSIQEPDLPGLGARFFSRQIISRETVEMVGNVATSRAVRASKLILAVMTHLELHPDKFETALEVFREELVYAEFSTLIKSSIGKCLLSICNLYTVLQIYFQLSYFYNSLLQLYIHNIILLYLPSQKKEEAIEKLIN